MRRAPPGATTSAWHDRQLEKIATGRTVPSALPLDAACILSDTPHAHRNHATYKIAQLGSQGRWEGNIERDFHTHINRSFRMNLDPIGVEVAHKNRNNTGISFEKVHIQLPHEVFAVQYQENQATFLESIGGGESGRQHVLEYWDRQKNTEWFRNFDLDLQREILTDPGKFYPMRMHGDDLPVTKHIQMLVLNLVSIVAAHSSTALVKILMAGISLGYILEDGIDEVIRIIVWSCMQLRLGVWPATDWEGRPWPEGSWRKRLGAAKRLLAGGFRAIVTELTGDWKYHKEVMNVNELPLSVLCLLRPKIEN